MIRQGSSPSIRHIVYKNFSGPKISGTMPFDLQNGAGHLDRILWVAARVETGGKFGGVNSYDGCGCSAGLVQNILVYPRELADEDFKAENDQGSLPELIEAMPDTSAKEALMWALAAEDWELKEGKLYYIKNKTIKAGGKILQTKIGQPVFGTDLRNTFTPVDGKVPAVGENWKRACYWATLVHNVFVDPATFQAQVEEGKKHLQTYPKRLRAANSSILDIVYKGDMGKTLTPEMDLAMTLFISHAVNSPATAQKCFNQALFEDKKSPGSLPFSLMKIMGTSTFGRWNSSEAGGRYQRTRNVMLELNTKLKCWDMKLFTTLLPTKF